MLIDHAIYVNYFRMRVLSKLREVRGEGHVDHQHDEGLRGQRSTMRFHVYYWLCTHTGGWQCLLNTLVDIYGQFQNYIYLFMELVNMRMEDCGRTPATWWSLFLTNMFNQVAFGTFNAANRCTTNPMLSFPVTIAAIHKSPVQKLLCYRVHAWDQSWAKLPYYQVSKYDVFIIHWLRYEVDQSVSPMVHVFHVLWMVLSDHSKNVQRLQLKILSITAIMFSGMCVGHVKFNNMVTRQ